MKVRHVLLAGVAFFAVSTAASAQNVVTTGQVGGTNSSTTYQAGYGNNIALLGQAGVGSNTASATQISARGSNLSVMGQLAGGSNTATVGQLAPRGSNFSDIGQISAFGSNSAAVGQASALNGVNVSGVAQFRLFP